MHGEEKSLLLPCNPENAELRVLVSPTAPRFYGPWPQPACCRACLQWSHGRQPLASVSCSVLLQQYREPCEPKGKENNLCHITEEPLPPSHALKPLNLTSDYYGAEHSCECICLRSHLPGIYCKQQPSRALGNRCESLTFPPLASAHTQVPPPGTPWHRGNTCTGPPIHSGLTDLNHITQDR